MCKNAAVVVALLLAPIAAYAQPNRTMANVTVFGAPNSAPLGNAWLIRDANSVTMTWESGGATPGNVYSLWWVFFNKPENCVDGCGLDDLGRPDVMATLLYADGVIPGDNGLIHAAGRRATGYQGVPLASM